MCVDVCVCVRAHTCLNFFDILYVLTRAGARYWTKLPYFLLLVSLAILCFVKFNLFLFYYNFFFLF